MLNNKTVGYLTASVLLVFLLKAIPVCAGAAEIKIASWNIYWLTSEDPDHHRRKANDYTRLAAYANDLGADVIALQEVDAGFVRKVFPPQQYRIELSNRRDTRQRTGFAIRKGIRYRRLPDYRELSTKWGLRYGAVIELDVGGRKIDLMSVHLKSGCFGRDLDRPITESCHELKSQVRPLEAWIDRRLERGRAFVLLGDFNRRMDRRSDDLWRFIADGNPKPVYRVNAGKRPKCWGSRFPEFIDHIVVGPIAGKAVKPHSFEELTYSERNYFRWRKRLSDHCPISVRLAF
ncbi:MAG: endonuclease/exonuclease/phosphatase family protein [Acidobacteriota bacterium]|nr:endonuclease/exonuclease/phosphatase family protein [Acidobacteriota bacterium]MDE2965079.1 endonuclease/exonuclease/phosphatase family protein [Acidobacteriota bacterium]